MANLGLDVLESIFDGSIQPTNVTFSALQSITENFSKERIIGDGGFGTVYKGVLRNNGEVAVKKIKNNQTIDEKLYRREVTSLLKVNHRNIVRFLGYCSHTEHKAIETEESGEFIYAETRERLLCFEYINNGSLENYITDELRGLQWDTRYSIIKGICEGLQYLHMKRNIIHMDLKPANILIDDSMVAKITDFGLSRKVENSQTRSTNRYLSPGYTAREYIDSGSMTVKCDVYSLGVIIIELVTGKRTTPDSNIVLRRWSHRWHTSGKETPFRYQQIAKLIEIGLLCQDNDPYKRPFISDIISVLNVLERTDRKTSNTNESTVGLISPYPEDDMLRVEPLVLRFPIELNTLISTSLEITNETNACFAFIIQTSSPLPYCIQPNKYIVAPRSKYNVSVTLQTLDHAPQYWQYNTGDFIVRSTKVNESLTSKDITADIFNKKEGVLVDEVNLTITYKSEVPPLDVSLGSLIITDTRSPQGAQESNVSQIKEKSKISATSDEVILFEPPELCFPLVPDRKVLSSIKITNVTEFDVSFILSFSEKNTAKYSQNDSPSILPPRSTRSLTITREDKQDAEEDMSLNDEVFVWYAIVDEDFDACNLVPKVYREWKSLPILLTNISSLTSDELIQLDPPELCMPQWPNKRIKFIVNVINTTDFYVAFNVYLVKRNAARDKESCEAGILPPRATKRCILHWRIDDGEPVEDYFVWNSVVTEGVKSEDIVSYMVEEESKKFSFIIDKVSPCPSDGLIHFDPPELSLPFVPNKQLVFSVNIVNNTDYYVGFERYHPETNVGVYYTVPACGVMSPRSTQRLVVERVLEEKNDQQEMHCQDKFFLWSSLVSAASEDSGIFYYTDYEGSKELPIVYQTSVCASEELIQFDPPQLSFSFSQNNTVSTFFSFKIVNITDHSVGFNIWQKNYNCGNYQSEPDAGILPPHSPQSIKVKRTPKNDGPEDMQCKDMLTVWTGIVTQGVEVSDLLIYSSKENKELPVVLTKISSITSDELIQLDPPELCMPQWPNKQIKFIVNVINTTDFYVAFNVYLVKRNAARDKESCEAGILPPRATKRCILHWTIDDGEPVEDYFVWNSVVTEGVKSEDIVSYMVEEESKKFSFIIDKVIPIPSNGLIYFDPPELSLPFVPNKSLVFSVNIVNNTDYYVGFERYHPETNVGVYYTVPACGVMSPRSTQRLLVERVVEEKNDQQEMHCQDKFFLWSSLVSAASEDSGIFYYTDYEGSKELPIVYQTSVCASEELIQFDPPQLSFSFSQNNTVSTFFSFKIVNITDHSVGFNIWQKNYNCGNYQSEPDAGILPPHSPQSIKVKRTPKNDGPEDMQCKDMLTVWTGIVTQGVEVSDLLIYSSKENKELPVVLTKISSITSDELIQLDPPELCMPQWPNKQIKFIVNVINTTDFYVAFNVYLVKRNAARDKESCEAGILPPRATKRCILHWTIDDGEPVEDYFVWNSVVTEGVKSEDIVSYMVEEESKKFSFIIDKVIPIPSNGLIYFDPPELSLPFVPNKSLVFSVNIVNNTDYYVGFERYHPETNVGVYYTVPACGVMSPRSTQRLLVERVVEEKNDQQEMHCQDKFFLYSSLVSAASEDSSIFDYTDYEGSKELPIVYQTSVCASEELIQFDPPRLSFPFSLNDTVCFFKIVNATDYSVGFNIWDCKENTTQYHRQPFVGILLPHSTESIKVTRFPKKEEREDMQCKDKITVWTGIVTQGVEIKSCPLFLQSLEKAVQVRTGMVESSSGRQGARQGFEWHFD